MFDFTNSFWNGEVNYIKVHAFISFMHLYYIHYILVTKSFPFHVYT